MRPIPPPRPQNKTMIVGIEYVVKLIKERNHALSGKQYYKHRADLLQLWQSKMRDPERKIVCSILANGHVSNVDEESDHENQNR
jgi:hypothetical protein